MAAAECAWKEAGCVMDQFSLCRAILLHLSIFFSPQFYVIHPHSNIPAHLLCLPFLSFTFFHSIHSFLPPFFIPSLFHYQTTPSFLFILYINMCYTRCKGIVAPKNNLYPCERCSLTLSHSSLSCSIVKGVFYE